MVLTEEWSLGGTGLTDSGKADGLPQDRAEPAITLPQHLANSSSAGCPQALPWSSWNPPVPQHLLAGSVGDAAVYPAAQLRNPGLGLRLVLRLPPSPQPEHPPPVLRLSARVSVQTPVTPSGRDGAVTGPPLQLRPPTTGTSALCAGSCLCGDTAEGTRWVRTVGEHGAHQAPPAGTRGGRWKPAAPQGYSLLLWQNRDERA